MYLQMATGYAQRCARNRTGATAGKADLRVARRFGHGASSMTHGISGVDLSEYVGVAYWVLRGAAEIRLLTLVISIANPFPRPK